MANITSYETAHGRRFEVRYLKPDGRSSRKRGFVRKKDAEQWMASHVTTAISQGTYVAPSDGRTTIAELWPKYVAAHDGVWKPSHLRPVESAWRVHVEPAFGSWRLDRLRHSDVQAWVSSMAKNRSASTTLRCFGVLKGLIELAARDRLIAGTEVVEDIRLPHKSKTRPERRYLTPRQLVGVADASGSHRLLVLVLGLCGLRWGEAAGLRVGDVDVSACMLHVRHTITKVGREYAEGLPKSWERRDVPVPASLMRILAAALPADDSMLVFAEPDGHPIRQQSSSPAWGWWSRALESAGVPRMTCHDLRHTAASIAVSSGANVKVLQRMLGHKSAAMTLDTYADLFESDLAGVSARVEERVRGLL